MKPPAMPLTLTLITVILVGGLVGCAAQLPPTTGSTQISKKQKIQQLGTYQNGIYAPSADEQALDCRKLSGRIHIRIAHMRDAAKRGGVSLISRGLQTVVTPVLGGTSYGVDPVGQVKQDRAQIDAYNELLKSKGCAAIDIDAELNKPE